MKILLIHNSYSAFSGEEAVFNAQLDLLKRGGHSVQTYTRGSHELKEMPLGQARGFFTGMYNRRSVREVRDLLRGQSTNLHPPSSDLHPQSSILHPPSIVHIHNLYPLISPAILPVIKASLHHSITSLPDQNGEIAKSRNGEIFTPPKIVMTVHNYRLICPNGLFFTHGEICERCAGGKEWNCITRNCEGNLFKSTGYALRNHWARIKRNYLDNVDAFLCLTEFQKNKLVENGFPPEACSVLPNFLPADNGETAINPVKPFILFAGRVNRQKGFDLLLKAAVLLPEVNFHVAGTEDLKFMKDLRIPPNIEMTGNLSKDHLDLEFRQASFLVFTSRSYEGFPMVFLEAMKHRIPVIAPDMAGFPEIIENGVNGLLFKPGDENDLAEKIKILRDDRDLCRRLGDAGHNKLITHYSPEVYYGKLMTVYESLVGRADRRTSGQADRRTGGQVNAD